MRVEVEVFNEDVTTPNNNVIPGICMECTRCGLEVLVSGQSSRSFKYGYKMLRDGCKRNESNYYNCVDEPEDDGN